jgi:hypothetical protein
MVFHEITMHHMIHHGVSSERSPRWNEGLNSAVMERFDRVLDPINIMDL